MNSDFKKLMSNKSDDILEMYIDHREKYVLEAVEAAIAELEKRGRILSTEEIASIRNEFQQKNELAEKLERESWVWKNGWKKNVVVDEAAPAYYSEFAIYMFSIFFSIIFGAVLLALNFRSTETKKGVWIVLVFGVIFSAIEIIIILQIGKFTGLSFLFSLGGAVILNYFFWQKYIGRDTKYRTKPIWKPLLIGVLIKLPFVLAAYYEMYT